MPTPEPELNAPLLLDRYQPLELIARGGSSLIYRGCDQNLGREIAIKLFTGGSETEVGRHREELRLLASLSHHGVVSVIDAGIDESSPHDPRPFLVMELVRGKTIRDTIVDRQLSAREIGEIGYEVAEALAYVHSRGVIHRDITPSNIMLVNYGSDRFRTRARLTDFGIAIESGSAPSLAPGITGTIAYLSPEQVRNGALSPRSDVYALGLVLLECFTGSQAFSGTREEAALARLNNDAEVPGSIAEPWNSLLRWMTHRETSLRPSAGEAAEGFRRALRQMDGQRGTP